MQFPVLTFFLLLTYLYLPRLAQPGDGEFDWLLGALDTDSGAAQWAGRAGGRGADGAVGVTAGGSAVYAAGFFSGRALSGRDGPLRFLLSSQQVSVTLTWQFLYPGT